MSIRLGVMPGTLRSYWERARRKLGAKNRSQVIALILKSVHHHAYEKLRQEKEYLELFMNGASDYGFLLMDQNGVFTSWNLGIERILGYAEEEFVGKKFECLFTAEQQQAGLPAAELLQARTQGPVRQSGWHMSKNRRFWGTGMLFALWDGELMGFGKVLLDATVAYEVSIAANALCEKSQELSGKISFPVDAPS